MSPTFPLVLLLSLSVPPASVTKTKTDEVMDHFALIRQTLKYWREIYKTYHQEVILGYCWAEYFLDIQDDVSMMSPMLQNHGNFESMGTNGSMLRSHGNTLKDEEKNMDSIEYGEKLVRRRRSFPGVNSADEKQTENVDEHVRNYAGEFIEVSSASRSHSITFRTVSKVDKNVDRYGGLKSERYRVNRFRGSYLETGRKFSKNATYHGRSFHEKNRSVGTPFVRWFRTNRVKDGRKVSEKPRNLEMDERRKVSHLETKHDTSVDDEISTERVFPSEVRLRENVNDRHFSFRSVASAYELPFARAKKIESSTNTNHTDGETSSNVEFHGGNYQSESFKVDESRWNENHTKYTHTDNLLQHTSRKKRNINTYKSFKHSSLNFPWFEVTKTSKYFSPSSNHSTKNSFLESPEYLMRNLMENERNKQAKRFDDNHKEEVVNDNRKQRGPYPTFVGSLKRASRNEPGRRPAGLLSLPGVRYGQFMGDYGVPTVGTSRNSKPRLRIKDQGRSSGIVLSARAPPRSLTMIAGLLRTLRLFVHVGRQIMDYVETNTALACTRDYLWIKAVQWIDG